MFPRHVYVVVLVDLWFNFCVLLFQTHYYTLPYPKPKENKIQTKDKIEPQPLYLILLAMAQIHPTHLYIPCPLSRCLGRRS